MFRSLIRSAFQIRSSSLLKCVEPRVIASPVNLARNFSLLSLRSPPMAVQLPTKLFSAPALTLNVAQPSFTQVRTVIKLSMRKGKRKSLKCVIKRFKRLDWGIWIRTRSARFKRLWKKSQSVRYRKRQHIFVNATQSTLLDKMVTSYWRRPRHYINDPYEPYNTRENYFATRKKPIEWDL